MFYHNHCGGNRSRYTAMCPHEGGRCFAIRQNVARGLFSGSRGCGCNRGRNTEGCGTCGGARVNSACGCGNARSTSSCGCSNTRITSSCGCGNTRTTSSCGCGNARMNAYGTSRTGCGCGANDQRYAVRRDTAYGTCGCGSQEDNETYLNPVCPCQRARMDLGGADTLCHVQEYPTAVPDCDVTVTPIGCRLPTPTQMPEHPAYAMTYTKMQDFGAMYTPNVAITRGTAFPCLDKPFCGETVGERSGCGCKGGHN